MILKTITPNQKQDLAREFHKEASKLDKAGCAKLRRKDLSGGYNQLEIARALRISANYMEGISAS